MISNGIDLLIAKHNPHAHLGKNAANDNDMSKLLEADSQSMVARTKQLTKLDLYYMQRHSRDRPIDRTEAKILNMRSSQQTSLSNDEAPSSLSQANSHKNEKERRKNHFV